MERIQLEPEFLAIECLLTELEKEIEVLLERIRELEQKLKEANENVRRHQSV